MSIRHFALLSFAALVGCASAPPQLSNDELRDAWRQQPFEKGKLPVGRVVEVEQFTTEIQLASPDPSRYAGLAPLVGYVGVLVIMNLDSGKKTIHAGYRHAVLLNAERRVALFNLSVPYKVGDCIAMRTGLEANNLEGASPVLALPGECGN